MPVPFFIYDLANIALKAVKIITCPAHGAGKLIAGADSLMEIGGEHHFIPLLLVNTEKIKRG